MTQSLQESGGEKLLNALHRVSKCVGRVTLPLFMQISQPGIGSCGYTCLVGRLCSVVAYECNVNAILKYREYLRVMSCFHLPP